MLFNPISLSYAPICVRNHIKINVVSPADNYFLPFGIPFVRGTFFEKNDPNLVLNKDEPRELRNSVRSKMIISTIPTPPSSMIPFGKMPLSNIQGGKNR